SPIRAPTLRVGNSGRATPSRRSPLAAPGGLLLRRPMAWFCSAVDSGQYSVSQISGASHPDLGEPPGTDVILHDESGQESDPFAVDGEAREEVAVGGAEGTFG